MFVANHSIYGSASVKGAKQSAAGSNPSQGSGTNTSDSVMAAHGTTVMSKLFAQIDAANIISLLVTGVPYNLSVYASNLQTLGLSLVLFDKIDGSVVPTSEVKQANAAVARITAMSSSQNEILGNFKPFLQLTQNYTADVSKMLEKGMQDSEKAYKNTFSSRGAAQSSSDQEDVSTNDAGVGVVRAYPNDVRIRDAYFDLVDGDKDSLAKSTGFVLPATKKEELLKDGKLQEDALFLTSKEEGFLAQYESSKHRKIAYERVGKIMTEQAKAQKQTSDGTTAENAVAVSWAKNTEAMQSSKRAIIKKQKQNFLVISDQYSANLDMQAYLAEISNTNMSELFRSSYQNPLKICKEVAETLVDFEFFCDENGHLRFKPPTYNRILPEHWEFARGTLPLGSVTDLDNKYPGGLAFQRIPLAQDLAESVDRFMELLQRDAETYEIKGTLNRNNNQTYSDLNSIKSIKPKSSLEEFKAGAALIVSKIKQYQEWLPSIQIEIDARTPPIQRRMEILAVVHGWIPGTVNSAEAWAPLIDYANTVKVLGLVPPYESYKVTEEKDQEIKGMISSAAAENKTSRENRLNGVIAWSNTIKEIRSYLSEKQFGKDSDQDLASATQAETSKEALAASTPYLIESSNIHRISPNIVLSETFSEKPPEYCRLDVQGGVNYLPGLQNMCGSTFFWAGGVDYDLWRDYGWRDQQITRPFIHSRESAKLYCQQLLARQRARIFTGSLTVRGDSKYRLADCVYIEDTYMYYYITNVSHSFSYGGDYTTTLTLEYGRRPGEFIAHPFDVIGSVLLNSAQRKIDSRFGKQSHV